MAEPISAAETKAAEEAGQNLNPEIHRVARRKRITIDLRGATNGEREPVTREEIFDSYETCGTRSTRRRRWKS